MAGINLTPANFLPTLRWQSIQEGSEVSSGTPFSAVAPSRFPSVPKLRIHLTLETIYEEDDQHDSLFSAQSACFLEVQEI